MEEATKPSGRGFQALSPERRKELASMGGKAAHQLGVAHKFTSEEAQVAGRKGGKISRPPKTKKAMNIVGVHNAYSQL